MSIAAGVGRGGVVILGGAGRGGVVIFGGAGSGAIVAETLAVVAAGRPEIACLGFLNDVLAPGALIGGRPVLGPFAHWRELPDNVSFVAPLHKAGAMRERAALVEALGLPAGRIATVIDPRSAVAADAVIAPGAYVGPFATVGPAARIGAHAVVRAGAHVSHDCAVGDFAFIGTNAVVCGYASLGKGSYVAPGAIIRDRCLVGSYALVGLGSTVVRDVGDGVAVAGSPARRFRAAEGVDG